MTASKLIPEALNPARVVSNVKLCIKYKSARVWWKVINRIGEAASVVVNAKDGKFTSMHDLRRSCGNNLATAGVPEREISKILLHASVETTRKYYAPWAVQESASIIRQRLSVPGYMDGGESP